MFEVKPKKWQCPDCDKWFPFNVPHLCKESVKDELLALCSQNGCDNCSVEVCEMKQQYRGEGDE